MRSFSLGLSLLLSVSSVWSDDGAGPPTGVAVRFLLSGVKCLHLVAVKDTTFITTSKTIILKVKRDLRDFTEHKSHK